MPVTRIKPRGPLAWLGLYTRAECERYAQQLGAFTRDHTRRRDVQAARMLALELGKQLNRKHRRALSPAEVAERVAQTIEELPDDGRPVELGKTELGEGKS